MRFPAESAGALAGKDVYLREASHDRDSERSQHTGANAARQVCVARCAYHERPLARRGRRDAPAVGHWLRTAGYQPDQVLCSTARRARQTRELARPSLGTDPPADCGA